MHLKFCKIQDVHNFCRTNIQRTSYTDSVGCKISHKRLIKMLKLNFRFMSTYCTSLSRKFQVYRIKIR